MFDFHEKRKIRGVLYSRPVIVIILFLTVLLFSATYNRYTVAREMHMKLELKERELQELKQRATTIQSKVEYLQGERGVEEELRNRFDAVREGEQVVIILDDKDKHRNDQVETEEKNVDTDDSFLQSFVRRFKFW